MFQKNPVAPEERADEIKRLSIKLLDMMKQDDDFRDMRSCVVALSLVLGGMMGALNTPPAVVDNLISMLRQEIDDARVKIGQKNFN